MSCDHYYFPDSTADYIRSAIRMHAQLSMLNLCLFSKEVILSREASIHTAQS